MLTDIEIAQNCKMEKITDIAKKLDIDEKYLELYGNYKAKIDYQLIKDLKDRKNGKLILVTAITPTPAGEGKTTTTVGLADGLRKIGKKSVVALREPSLGPVLKVEQPEAAMRRSFRWKISTFTLPVTSMRSVLQTIFWQL